MGPPKRAIECHPVRIELIELHRVQELQVPFGETADIRRKVLRIGSATEDVRAVHGRCSHHQHGQ